MKGNFISSNTWSAVRVNDTEISLPNLENKKYSLLESKKENLDFSYIENSFSKELNESLKNFKNLELDFVADSNIYFNKTVCFELNDENNQLVDVIRVKANENSNLNLTLDYFSTNLKNGFRNSVIEIEAEKNSNVNIVLSQRFSLDVLSIQSVYINAKCDANVKVIQIDLGSKENYVSYVSDLSEKNSNIDIKSIYFGEKNQKLDYNYISNQIAKDTNYNLYIKGALADKVCKTCKASIDFKRGSSGSKGAEEEFVTLLSDDVRNVAVPILLCTEDDVEGLHAASAGKIDENILFYIMSRGFSESNAKKLILESQFAQIIDLIEDEDIRSRVYLTLSEKLSEV